MGVWGTVRRVSKETTAKATRVSIARTTTVILGFAVLLVVNSVDVYGPLSWAGLVATTGAVIYAAVHGWRTVPVTANPETTTGVASEASSVTPRAASGEDGRENPSGPEPGAAGAAGVATQEELRRHQKRTTRNLMCATAALYVSVCVPPVTFTLSTFTATY